MTWLVLLFIAAYQFVPRQMMLDIMQSPEIIHLNDAELGKYHVDS